MASSASWRRNGGRGAPGSWLLQRLPYGIRAASVCLVRWCLRGDWMRWAGRVEPASTALVSSPPPYAHAVPSCSHYYAATLTFAIDCAFCDHYFERGCHYYNSLYCPILLYEHISERSHDAVAVFDSHPVVRRSALWRYYLLRNLFGTGLQHLLTCSGLLSFERLSAHILSWPALACLCHACTWDTVVCPSLCACCMCGGFLHTLREEVCWEGHPEGGRVRRKPWEESVAGWESSNTMLKACLLCGRKKQHNTPHIKTKALFTLCPAITRYARAASLLPGLQHAAAATF